MTTDFCVIFLVIQILNTDKVLGKLINFEGLGKKHAGKVIDSKFEYSIILSRWIIDSNFKFQF